MWPASGEIEYPRVVFDSSGCPFRTTPGTTYAYRVIALRSDSRSAPSNDVSVVMPAPGEKISPPSARAVTGLSVVTAGPRQATATVPVDSVGTVHLRFALAGTENWNSLSTTAELGEISVEINLNGLTPNAVYDVQASQDSGFPGTAATRSVTFTNRPAHLDLALDSDHDNPWGIWGNASTLWVAADYLAPTDKRLYAYNRSDGSRDSGKDFETLSDAGNSHIGGIWSDGTTMFVVDWRDGKVYAYGLSTRQRTAGGDLDLVGSNDGSRGIWGNASTLWVAEHDDRPDHKLYAYNRSDGSRDFAKDFDTLKSAGNQAIGGIWSDGSTMFVADSTDDKLYGYHMGSRWRWARQDIDLVPENTNPSGVWGDDGKIWVANDGFGTTNKVFAYYTPVVDTIVSDISPSNVTETSATATVWIASSDGTARTVHLRHREETSAAWTDAPSQTTAAVSTEFTLMGLSGGARYVVQASFDSTFSDGTEVTAAFQARPQDQDFRLEEGNGDARGIWSNGSILWVVNDGSGDDDRVFAYTVSTKAHDAGNSFGLDSGNAKPGGEYANAGVMWVPDRDDDSVYAYAITSGSSYGDVDTSKGFAMHTGAGLADIIVPTGAWSDGSTLWVAGHVREQVYAYNIGSTGTFGARDTSKECDLATDYSSPRGMWSDGSTLWVADSAEDRVFAYGITSGGGCGERRPLREIRLVDENSDPWGIWSDGTTLWVADAADDKVYAYTLPSAPSGDITGVAFDRITRTEADITVTFANPDATQKSVELTYEAVPGGAPVTSTASTSDTSVEFILTGLTENADYALRVRVDSGGADRAGGLRTQSSTDELREYLKNSLVGREEEAQPRTRETYNAMRRHDVPVVASHLTTGRAGFVKSICSLALSLSELHLCFIQEFHMDDRSVRHTGRLIHEVAHVYTRGSGHADEPAEYLGMGWLYFRDLAEGGSDCFPDELYADGIGYVHESDSQYYYDQCTNTGNKPSADTVAVVERVLARETPDWFKDEYEGDGLPYDTSSDPKYDRTYDLERVWADLQLSNSSDRSSAVYQFRNAFGGYCDPTKAYQAAFESGPTRNPWRAGGCVPQAPPVTVVMENDATVVSWRAPAYDSGSPITSHRVEWRRSGEQFDASRSAEVTGPSHSVVGLGTGSAVRVTAYNHNGWGVASLVEDTGRLGAPENVRVVPDDGILTVAWDAPAGPVSRYVVQWKLSSEEWSASPAQATVTGGVLTYTITGLVNGVGYTVRVAAVSAFGVSSVSAEFNRRPFVIGPPLNLRYATQTTFDGDGRWRARVIPRLLGDHPGTGAPVQEVMTVEETMRVWDCTWPAKSPGDITHAPENFKPTDPPTEIRMLSWVHHDPVETRFVDIGTHGGGIEFLDDAERNRFYEYRVRAVDDQGVLGAPSNVIATKYHPEGPDHALNLRAAVQSVGETDYRVTLTWDPPADTANVTGYRIFRYVRPHGSTDRRPAFGEPLADVDQTQTTFTDLDVSGIETERKEYTYAVRALTHPSGPHGPHESRLSNRVLLRRGLDIDPNDGRVRGTLVEIIIYLRGVP